jgi:hypothetical protein
VEARKATATIDAAATIDATVDTVLGVATPRTTAAVSGGGSHNGESVNEKALRTAYRLRKMRDTLNCPLHALVRRPHVGHRSPSALISAWPASVVAIALAPKKTIRIAPSAIAVARWTRFVLRTS